MAFSTALLDRLAADLGAALGDRDLPVAALVRAVTSAVPSCCGVQVVLGGDAPVTLTWFEPDARAADLVARLHLPLTALGHRHHDAVAGFTFHGRVPGAFDALAAHLGDALGVPAATLLHRGGPPATVATSVAGTAELGLVRRAEGVLLDRGVTLDEVAAELRRGAVAAGLTLPAHARRVLASTGADPAAPGPSGPDPTRDEP